MPQVRIEVVCDREDVHRIFDRVIAIEGVLQAETQELDSP